jgi:hypothetical protein
MRLVVTAGLQRVWVVLEPETGEEAMALEACAARGEWTNGHGADAIVRLQALATRLGFPVTFGDAVDLVGRQPGPPAGQPAAAASRWRLRGASRRLGAGASG